MIASANRLSPAALDQLRELVYMMPNRLLLLFWAEVYHQVTCWKLGLDGSSRMKIVHGSALLRYLELVQNSGRSLQMWEWAIVTRTWQEVKRDALMGWAPLPRVRPE